jgi:uncharacterized protein (DUF697 family)
LPFATNQGLERYQVRVVTAAGADPAADGEQIYTVPTGQIFELYAVNFNYVTDANAANRRVILTIDDGATVFAKSVAGAVQAASLTYNYTFAVGAPTMSAVVDLQLVNNLPGPLFLVAGDRIQTVTTNQQATDNYGVMTIQGIRYSA